MVDYFVNNKKKKISITLKSINQLYLTFEISKLAACTEHI